MPSGESITIVIPTKNAGPGFAFLRRHLAQLRERYRPDILVIDSGSTDTTADDAEHDGFRVHRIPPDGFGHGRTRNLAVRLARGEVICFLTQDVLPCTPDWPILFARALDEPGIAGVYGRQVPRDASTMEMFFVTLNYPAHPLRFRPAPNGHHPRPGRVLFSNAFSAVRRDVALRIPFLDHVPVSEDQVWAYQVLRAGYSILYEPAAEALHAHTYSLRGLFRRTYRVGRTLASIGIGGGASFPESVRFLATELAYFVRQGHTHRLPQLIAYELVRWLGFQTGRVRVGVGSGTRSASGARAATERPRRRREPDRYLSKITRKVGPRPGTRFAIEMLRQHYARRHAARDDRFVVIHNFDGDLKIKLDRSAYIGSLIYWTGYQSKGELRLLDRILRPDMVLVDVGANLGEFTLHAAKRLRSGRVIAFEPVGEMHEHLLENIRANGFANVTVYRVALSDRSGSADLYVGGDPERYLSFNEGLGSLYPRGNLRQRIERVRVDTLDRILSESPPPRVNVVKVDVEGAELQVLRGSWQTLSRYRPKILLEVNREAFEAAGYAAADVIGFLEPLGYRFSVIARDGGLQPLESCAIPEFGNLLCDIG